jgi:hypothetical protein
MAMILPDLCISGRRWEHSKFSGLDNPQGALDKKHFETYPHAVDYQYNSRGFRDAEWPTDITELQQAVWCVGDSFTAGVGAPAAHTWPQILQQRLARRTINVSLDGGSNNWIARRVRDIAQQVTPRVIIVHWSYDHRREAVLQDILKTIPSTTDLNTVDLDSLRRLHHVGMDSEADVANTQSCIDQVTALTVPVIHSFIPPPRHTDAVFDFKSQLSVPKFHQLDWARDGHHYDILTAEWFVDQLMLLLQQLNVA